MTPIRTCVVCRTRRDDVQMVRAGRSVDGTWHLGRGTGRGVWWCAGTDCIDELRLGQVGRALRAPVGESDLVEIRALERSRGRT